MIRLQCIVERIVFQNAENGYTVLKAKAKGYTDLITLVGYLMDLPAGTVLLIQGNWQEDKKFGPKFAVDKWEEVMPSTLYGIEKYLGSGMVKGVGPTYAKRIVEKFGLDTIYVIENEIVRLLEIEGLGKRRMLKIQESWEKQKEVKNVMVFLQGHGVSTAYAAKIYRTYGKESISVVKNNPYTLADDIWGVGFKTADAIAQKLGYEKDDERRCRSGLMYTLTQLATDGHVYAQEQQLLDRAKTLLEIDEDKLKPVLSAMIQYKDLYQEEDAIYLPTYYFAEKGSAEKLLELLHRPLPPGTLFNFCDTKARKGIQYDEIQLKAIDEAVKSKVLVLTGGPGTGKTTTTQGIIAALKSMDLKILLAAPTGRAAKRMSEATGMPAKTIHRLLTYTPMEGYQRNEENQLEGDVLIVDEASMIDIQLFYALLKAVPPTMRLILVGDIDQLPSVGAGNVLRDLIDSEKIPVVRLTRIFRQAQSSRIITNAHKINQGILPDITNGKESDFFFLQVDSPEEVIAQIVNLVQNRLPKAYREKVSNIQVLTPMHRGGVGSDNLNQALQRSLNPSGAYLTRGGTIYRQGDRIMQIRNNYDKDVYNGDIGIIDCIDTDENTLSADFDGKMVWYELGELDEVTLAYATTIHKSQGSEYPIVVIPVLMSHYMMLQRNLIYTAITRSKKVCVLIGSTDALAYAVKNFTVNKRNSRLKERLMKG